MNNSTIDEKRMEFSVLLSTYHKEQPQFFTAALDSVFSQTLPAPEVVLVCDGPLTPELDALIEGYQAQHPEVLKVVRLEKNGGLGNALNEGMKNCTYDIVVRMDTDDIAFPTRFERQITFLHEHPEVDLLSSSIDEFVDSPSEVISRRTLPEKHEEIVRFARYRCPVNHPAVAFRKAAILKAGGYMHFPLFEDYYLWARVILQGGRLHSLPEPLLYFRMNHATLGRRRGWYYIRRDICLQKTFYKIGFINKWEYVRNLMLRIPPRLVPGPWLYYIYKRFLRKRIND